MLTPETRADIDIDCLMAGDGRSEVLKRNTSKASRHHHSSSTVPVPHDRCEIGTRIFIQDGPVIIDNRQLQPQSKNKCAV